MRIRLRRLRGVAVLTMALLIAVAVADTAFAGIFYCASGDAVCLIDSIRSANQTRRADTIILEAGTYTLTVANNTVDGSDGFPHGNGLPSITGRVTVIGAGASDTIIERDSVADPFRIFHIAATGILRLHGVTIQGGVAQSGGGIFNRGALALSHSVVRDNQTVLGDGGGILNLGTLRIHDSRITGNSTSMGFSGGIDSDGSLEILRSTIDHNLGREGTGGIGASGSTTIDKSSITENRAIASGGGGLSLTGTAIITNTTIAKNAADIGLGGGLAAFGTVRLTNVTIADNLAFVRGGGLVSFGDVQLQNTILARNTVNGVAPDGPDCSGDAISLGSNIISDTADCTIDLQASDLVGDPVLGQFQDDGTPGHAHIPLLAESPAIDAGNRTACSPRDQLGNRRVDGDGNHLRTCDIGSVEFVPAAPVTP